MYTAASITTQGRSAISACITLFEAFLANNNPFGTLDEIVTFIYNVRKEDRYYNDIDILDDNVSIEECFNKLILNCGFNYVPKEEEMVIIWEMLLNVSQQDLNRLYYKNNLYSFMENSSMTKAITIMLQKLSFPYLDPNTVPKDIEIELETFWGLLKEFVYYRYQTIDRLDKVEVMIRSVSIIIDTDSCILSLDSWYNYVLSKVKDVPMTIKRQMVNPIEIYKEDEFGDRKLIKAIEYVEPEYEYDFYNDEMVKVEKLVNPCVILPQDGLRHSIINIMAYCITKASEDYMIEFTKTCNSYDESKPCYMYLKNEFLFYKALVLDVKKNYGAIHELKEGHKVPEDNSLQITGIAALTKSTMNESTRNNLQKILYEDILKSDNIDQVRVLKSLAKAEKTIYTSIINGDREYYKPLKVKAISNYDSPMSIQGIKASIVYNALRDKSLPAIDLDKRNSIDVVKVNITPKTISKIKDEEPELYNKIVELMNIKEFAKGIDAIALPLNIDIPKWMLKFVDYTTIINDNLSGFPLESLGIYRGHKNNNYTNIISL